MTNYAIDDQYGNKLTAGLQEHNAHEVAQQMANDRGESVWLYETGENEEDSEYIEVEPR